MASNGSKGTTITMPQLAESVVSATIAKWLKQPGDTVEEYEPICEIVTDKVTAELPSTVSGILTELLAAEGETVEVGAPVCRIDAAGSEGAALPAAGDEAAGDSLADANAGSTADQSMRGRISPAVRHLADEHGIDLNEVPGTGLGGRITRKDVRAFIERGGKASVAAEAAAPAAETGTEDVTAIPLRSTGLHLSQPEKPLAAGDGDSGEYLMDVTPVRSTIASRMRQSVSEIPHAWMMIEADVTNLVLLRNKLKDEFFKREGIKLTYMPFIIKAVVNAIKDFPIMNSVWAVDKIIVKRDINISLAVGTEDAVYTPVIKKADQKNIAGLARELEELTRNARNGKLKLSDMQGGTFTINNTGAFGSILSQPIINYPQAANFTMESIVKKPVVIDDMIAVRSMVNFCLSLDHRILDGLICGRFMQRVKENVEAYNLETKLY